MTVAPQVYFIAGVAALLGVMALVSRVRERKRREAYTEYCLIRGFKYEPQRAEVPSVDQLDEWLEQGDHVRRRFFKT